MEKGIYLNLQMKRAFKLYPSILLVTIVIVSCIAIVFAGILYSAGQDSSKICVRTGVVGDVEGSYLGIGVEAIKNTDSSRFYIDLINMTENQAKNALKNGDISGYVYIPEGFVNDATSGKDTSLKYISLKDPGAINAMVEQEVVTTIASLVSRTRQCIYGAVDIGKDFNQKGIYKKINKLNLSYISLVLNRDKICDIVISESGNNLSCGGYYLCALIIFFLCIWGISCNGLICGNGYELSALLNLRGIGFARQFLAKLISFFAITFLTLVIFAFAFGLVSENVNLGIPEITAADVVTSVVFTVKILPAVFVLVSVHILLCEILHGISGLLAQFIILTVLGYLSGIFYPTHFFPAGIQIVMAYLPLGAAFSYVKNALAGADVFKEFVICLVYGAIFVASGICVRKHKVTGGARL